MLKFSEYSSMRQMQRVARVCLRQLILVVRRRGNCEWNSVKINKYKYQLPLIDPHDKFVL